LRTLTISKNAFEDFQFWLIHEPKTLKKIFELLDEIQKNPFVGKGKPEPLKHNLKGMWSRRINDEHRLVYEIENETVNIHSARWHYND
jgi:toxin YoeB